MPQSIADYAAGFFHRQLTEYRGNVHVSLSGGRSSAAMLRLLLDVYGGSLPPTFKTVFTNTGKEHPETLRFLRRIRDNWKVDIICLELTAVHSTTSISYKIIDLDQADETGQPWQALRLGKPKFPPRRSARICTQYMKILPAREYLEKELGWASWTHLLGYRADERGRLYRASMRCGKHNEPFVPDAPLIVLGIDKPAVRGYFKQAEFDLELDDRMGNCIWCFMKSENTLKQLYQLPDARADIQWWIELEAAWGEGTNRDNYEQFFIMPNGGYAGFERRILETGDPPVGEFGDIEDLECHCTD